MAIFATILCANLSDHFRCRWPVNMLMALALLITSIILLIPSIPTSAYFAAYYLSGIGYAGQASNFAWANDVCADDEQERAVVLASMNLWSNVINAFWGITLYPATTAPRFHRGFIAMIVLCFVVVAVTLVVRHYDLRERREKGRLHPEEEVDGQEALREAVSTAAGENEKARVDGDEKAQIVSR